MPKHAEVHGIFEKIAGYYDRMNTVMTLGGHARWCREVAARAAPPPGGRLLDLATGTGAIALAAARRYPAATVTGVDFSERMLLHAKTKPGAHAVHWLQADATRLPFDNESFDAVTEGYLLRNTDNLAEALHEQRRVLRTGGRLVILETCPPTGPLEPLLDWALRTIVPLLGRLVSGDRTSYTYLESSTRTFDSPRRLAILLSHTGFHDIGWTRKFFGTNVILWATKAQ
ncbi:ubiquinone/menaquinone biosynthesis methyltransferase [Nocardia sp. ET3-3]|uniref:Demethylmenaquinone methyltransferase n=1 Tax=Nocardia terrae TaxID=2675851 RepID=A0A7K1V9P6_9NOCA|nr:ubiquinone/menaquinone biosynthesis methyltransferase [Nocardia terrae]MVU83364.1 ubiquinone/menaquinone biosynthesis methyltransferase [Nocardia terrae]